MTDMLSAGMGALAETLLAHGAQDVIYRRGSKNISIRAALGKSVFETDNGEDMPVQVETRDFICKASDLILDGTAILPAARDRISLNGRAHEVLSIPGAPPYRYCDASRILIRIHTKPFGADA